MGVCSYCQVQCEGKSCICGRVVYCHQSCQKKDWSRHSSNCPPYKVSHILGKGRGLVATRRIKAGEVVVEENPLIVIEGHQRQFKLSHEEFRSHFEKLDSNHQKKILELYDPTADQCSLQQADLQGKPDEDTSKNTSMKAFRIFSNNSINVCEVAELQPRGEGGLYNQISLLNHSCNPNSSWSWVLGNLRRKVVRAVRTIGKNEEIQVNYLDQQDFNFASRQLRREKLLEEFYFICQCAECSLDNEAFASNERTREEIRGLTEDVQKLMIKYDKASTVSALVASQTIVRLTRYLRLDIEIPRMLLDCYQVALAAQYLRIPGAPSPGVFRDEALAYCQKYGDSFMYFYNSVVK